MKKVKEFQKVFLYKNEEGINATIKQMEEGKDALNLFILSTERVMRTKFDDDDKIELKNNAIKFLKETLKKHIAFPLASEEFNLEAMGLQEVSELYNSFEFNSGKWLSFNYFLNEKGIFELEENEIKNTIESFSSYTQNEKQNEVLELAEKMIVLFDEAEKLGVLNGHGRQQITNVFDVLTIDVHPEIGEYRIMIHQRFLSTKYLF